MQDDWKLFEKFLVGEGGASHHTIARSGTQSSRTVAHKGVLNQRT